MLTSTIQRLLPAGSYLDAGCGDGRYLAALPEFGPLPARIVGVDIAESILRTARKATAAAGFEPELVAQTSRACPSKAKEFDLVVSIQVLEHLLDPVAGARELARVLRPSGALVLSTASPHARAAFDFPHSAYSLARRTSRD